MACDSEYDHIQGVSEDYDNDPDFSDFEEDAIEEGGFTKSKSESTPCLELNDASEADHRCKPPATISTVVNTRVTNNSKRSYIFKKRNKNPRTISKIRVKWNNVRDGISVSDLQGRRCCKKLQCFKNANLPFLIEKIKLVLSMSSKDRRHFLASMLGSTGKYYFDGNQVCVAFLSSSFHYSRDILGSIRSASEVNHTSSSSDGSCFSQSSQTIVPFTSDSFQNTTKYQSNPTSSVIFSAPCRESIVSYLNRVAENTGDKMPDSNEQHLPFYKKFEVYENFIEDFKKINPTGRVPSKNYFLRTWKTSCKNIKIRKHNRFSKCDICESLKDELRRAVARFEPTSHLLEQKRNHFRLIAAERQEYKSKRDKAIADPSSAWSLIIDGADQTAFGLPHFSSTTKAERGHAIKVKLVGMLEHACENRLRLLTMTEEHQTGANHIVESLHRFLMDRSLYSQVPPTLYLQFDNCTRENKNRFFLSYVECLVRWRVFKQVEVSFLPVGHTHEDIDQAFSTTSKRLHVNDAITLNDLQNEIRQVYNRHTSVSHMRHVINWSGLCNQEAVLTTIKNFSHYRYFRFVSDNENQEVNSCSLNRDNPSENASLSEDPVRLMVRAGVYDDWEEHPLTFVKKTPDLTKTPSTIISDGTNKDSNNSFAAAKAEVTKRIESVEARIRHPQKLLELQKLRDEIFRPRKERFHWNISSCIELRNTINQTTQGAGETPPNSKSPSIRPVHGALVDVAAALSDDEPLNCESTANDPKEKTNHELSTTGYTYDVGSFVAVLSESSDGHSSFWIGKITKINQDKYGVVNTMMVRWYEPYARKGSSADKFVDKYAPACLDRHTSRERPWTDSVDTTAVLINFSSLLRNGRLPCAVQKHLRTSLPSC